MTPSAGWRSSTSLCSPTGRGWCAGRPRTPDAAQLRDQLRQAAKTWDEHGRTDDMLWSGSAYREYSLWRERYPGGLTETEGGVRNGDDGIRREAPPSQAARRGDIDHLRLARGPRGGRFLLAAQRAGDPPRRGGEAPRPGPDPAREGRHRGAGLRDVQPRARRHSGGARLCGARAVGGAAGERAHRRTQCGQRPGLQPRRPLAGRLRALRGGVRLAEHRGRSDPAAGAHRQPSRSKRRWLELVRVRRHRPLDRRSGSDLVHTGGAPHPHN